MKQSFQLFDSLVEKAGGSKEKVFDLLNREGTVRDITKLTGKKISQENVDTVLPYSAIFGPRSASSTRTSTVLRAING